MSYFIDQEINSLTKDIENVKLNSYSILDYGSDYNSESDSDYYPSEDIDQQSDSEYEEMSE